MDDRERASGKLPFQPFFCVNESANEISVGRDTTSTVIPFPLDFRLSRVQGTDHGREPAHDDALWARHCRRITQTAVQGQPLQMSILSQRESSSGSEEGFLVGPSTQQR